MTSPKQFLLTQTIILQHKGLRHICQQLLCQVTPQVFDYDFINRNISPKIFDKSLSGQEKSMKTAELNKRSSAAMQNIFASLGELSSLRNTKP